jgi:hypothetical protein
VKAEFANDGVSFLEGMRLLAGIGRGDDGDPLDAIPKNQAVIVPV